MSQRRDEGLARRAAIGVAACAAAVLAWSETERVRSRASADAVARRLARVEAALAGALAPSAVPVSVQANGVRVDVGVDAFGALATTTVVAGERP